MILIRQIRQVTVANFCLLFLNNTNRFNCKAVLQISDRQTHNIITDLRFSHEREDETRDIFVVGVGKGGTENVTTCEAAITVFRSAN